MFGIIFAMLSNGIYIAIFSPGSNQTNWVELIVLRSEDDLWHTDYRRGGYYQENLLKNKPTKRTSYTENHQVHIKRGITCDLQNIKVKCSAQIGAIKTAQLYFLFQLCTEVRIFER